MYAKVENGVVVEWKIPEPVVLATRPNTSFALPLSDETLQELGFARFAHTVEPDHDPELEEVKEIAPVLDGIMATQSWEVVQRFSDEERAAKLAERAERSAELAATKYQRQRAAEYPPMADYLDGIVKGDQAQVQAYIDACLAVKAKYPKPNEGQ